MKVYQHPQNEGGDSYSETKTIDVNEFSESVTEPAATELREVNPVQSHPARRQRERRPPRYLLDYEPYIILKRDWCRGKDRVRGKVLRISFSCFLVRNEDCGDSCQRVSFFNKIERR